MAPELAESRLSCIAAGGVVLDPMMGSGTFPLAAARAGLRAIGLDTDPLAVTIARAAASSCDASKTVEVANEVLARARAQREVSLTLDEETRNFINYWFD